LRSLGPAAEKDHQGIASAYEIDAVSWAKIDAKLGDTFADGPQIPGISKRQSSKPNIDAGSRLPVPKLPEPSFVSPGLPNLDRPLM
jgi:hypothetical protein